MPRLAVFNMQGEVTGEIELSDQVFGAEADEGLAHQIIKMQLANRRAGTAATKTRARVAGGGRKPWRQKGTGRARHGTIRSPIWRGGGIVFGPSPRDYGYTVPKKLRRAALRAALSAKVRDNNLLVVDKLVFDEPKTRLMAQTLHRLNASGRVMVVTGDIDYNVIRSARNIPGVETSRAVDLNVYDVVKSHNLVLTRDAVAKVEEVLGNGA